MCYRAYLKADWILSTIFATPKCLLYTVPHIKVVLTYQGKAIFDKFFSIKRQKLHERIGRSLTGKFLLQEEVGAIDGIKTPWTKMAFQYS